MRSTSPLCANKHLLLVLLVFVLITSLHCSPPSSSPPNILLIVSDDQGCGDAGFMGNDRLKTPHLDQLAAEGMTLNAFHVAPVCAPTRAGLLTGRHHLRTGVRGVIEGREFMVAEEVTLAELLGTAGYRTALFGKWHLGENYPWLPHGQGFDEYIGFRKGSSDYFDVTLDHKGNPYPTTGYLTDVLTDLAIDFIEEENDHPFFLYLPYNAPHGPLQVPDSYLTPYNDLPDRTASIYGMMASLDENIGRLLHHLDERGLSDNTIVLFFSDNGPLYGNRNTPVTRFNCGLRGQKYDVYQGGVRVPLLVRWPDHIPAASQSNDLTDHTDLMPTLLEAAGVAIPDSLALDGQSLLPVLTQGAATPPDRMLFMTYPGEQVKHKPEAPYPGGMAITKQFKMVDGSELYDIALDPGESVNLAESHPEILASMDSAYQVFWTEATAERAPYPRPHIGHPEENPVVLSSHFADLSGGLLFQFSDDPPRFRSLGVHHDTIGKWESNEGKATWRLHVAQPGMYQVTLRLQCTGSTQVDATVQTGEQSITQPGIQCSISDPQWHDYVIGALDWHRGDADLSISLTTHSSDPSVQLDKVIIEHRTD